MVPKAGIGKALVGISGSAAVKDLALTVKRFDPCINILALRILLVLKNDLRL